MSPFDCEVQETRRRKRGHDTENSNTRNYKREKQVNLGIIMWKKLICLFSCTMFTGPGRQPCDLWAAEICSIWHPQVKMSIQKRGQGRIYVGDNT